MLALVISVLAPLAFDRALLPLLESETCPHKIYTPKHYTSYFTPTPPTIDGVLDEPLWEEAAWTDEFVDISTSVIPRFKTWAKIRWDKEFLYVGALLHEPDVWANVTDDNDVIFHDNDFEVFVDTDGSTHNYKEFEINALGISWRLLLDKPYGDGGHENSKRVDKENGWDMRPPLQCASYVNGTVNDPSDSRPDKYWTAEIALPIAKLMDGKSQRVTASHGSIWRINFSRVEWHVNAVGSHYEKDQNFPAEDNWVWSPQGEIAMHLPERWGFLQLSTDPVNTTAPVIPKDWIVRSIAMDLYYAQHAVKNAQGSFTQDVELLAGYAPNKLLDGKCGTVLSIRATEDAFLALIQSLDGEILASIRDDRFLTTTL